MIGTQIVHRLSAVCAVVSLVGGTSHAQVSRDPRPPLTTCNSVLASAAFASWAVYEGTTEEGSPTDEYVATLSLPRPFNTCSLPTRVAWDGPVLRYGPTLAKLQIDGSHGYRARAYYDDRQHVWILAFRGTDSPGAKWTDAEQVFSDGVPLQYLAAKETALNLSEALLLGKLPNTNSPIVVTGHSLGGALATYAGGYTQGTLVRTFNPAQLGYSLREWTSVAARSDLERRVVHYRVDRDVVSSSGPDLLGPVVTLPLPPATEPATWPHAVAVSIRATAFLTHDPAWATADRRVRRPSASRLLGGILDIVTGGTVARGEESIRAHSMSTVLAALSSNSGSAVVSDPEPCLRSTRGNIWWLVRLATTLIVLTIGAAALGRAFSGSQKLVSLLGAIFLFVLAGSVAGPTGAVLFLVVSMLATVSPRRVGCFLTGIGALGGVGLYYVASRAEFGTSAWCALTAP